jgi:two-component system OmpR family sensor kinase
LSLWYAAVLSVVLIAFAATIYLVIERDEANEPPAVAALEPPDQTAQHVLTTLVIVLPIAVAIAIGGGVLITRRALRGLVAVTRAASELDGSSLHRRLDEPAGAAAEVAQLTSALNAMLARVEASVAGARRFTEDASHELRTPIAALMGEIEVTLRKPRDAEALRAALEAALEGLADVSRLLDALLTLARSDAGQLQLAPEAVDLGELVARVLEPYEVLALERRVELELRRAGAARVLADPLWLGRAVANVIDNALKFTPPGGRVGVSVEERADQAVVVVRDSGPGIAVENQERIFERFFRSAGNPPGVQGSGLGLALARDIARASHGDLVLQRDGTSGAVFQLSVPRRAHSTQT